MSRSISLVFLLFTGLAFAGPFPGIGRPATPAEIKAWDIDVRPDFKGLPPGSGSVAKGQKVWDEKCASCHGTFGESNEVFAPLIGGTTAQDVKAGRVKALSAGEQRTSIMKLATVSTLWDYINRAMPWNAPKTLTTEEVYAVTAYMLHLADILPADFVLSDRNIAEVQQKLPNRHGMRRDHGLWEVKGKPDVANVACMKDCAVEPKLVSSLPAHARDTHGNLADQNRTVGPSRGTATNGQPSPPVALSPVMPMTEIARHRACFACHHVEKRVVGPSFREVAARYQGQPGVEAKLAQKLRKGSTGAWGAVPMPPNPDLPESEAAALARWIMAGAG